jgi:hypothetical protein
MAQEFPWTIRSILYLLHNYAELLLEDSNTNEQFTKETLSIRVLLVEDSTDKAPDAIGCFGLGASIIGITNF